MSTINGENDFMSEKLKRLRDSVSHMRKRPRIWLINPDVGSFMDFLLGFDVGADTNITREFSRFVTKKYNEPANVPASNIIKDFDLLLYEFDEFISGYNLRNLLK